MNKYLLSTVLLVLGVFAPAPATQAAPTTPATPVVVVVSIPIPAGLTRATIEKIFVRDAPAYQALPDLKQKYFTINEETKCAGGIYLWNSRAAADAYYTEAWKASVVKAFGSPASLTWFDAPLIIQGKAGMP